MEYTPELVKSVERLNIFFHVHHCNEMILNNVGKLIDRLKEQPDTTMSPEALLTWLTYMGDNSQTIDALMHIAQEEFVGEATEWVREHSEEECLAMREGIESPIMDKMMRILEETTEERTQRLLLEMLNIHE